MKVEQLYTGCLAEAAYYIESNGEAAIIDPLREPEPYLKKLKDNNAKLKYIFETHFHADFVSGHVDLAKKTGATIVFGPTAQPEYDAYIAKDGEEFKIGNVTITAIHTPGHTMESTTYLLKDENGKEVALFTGDTLFIGDVGRPDLAVKSDLTKEDLAGHLYDSLHNKILKFPDDIIIYPGHGAGSACGKNIGKETFDTLGHQKEVNYALRARSKEDFIKEVTEGLLPPPQYFAKNAMLNKKGPGKSFDDVMKKGAVALDPDTFEAMANHEGALVLDVRSPQEFAKEHIPNSINIGLDGQFAPWVGALIPDLNQPIIFIAPEGREQETVTRLSRVGYDNTLGYLEGGLEAWKKAGKETDWVRSIPAEEFAQIFKTENIASNVLDVRKPTEYQSEHIKNVENYPLDYINNWIDKLDKNETYYVHCAGGYRSMITCSILKSRGYHNVIDIAGGFDAIKKNDIPVTEYVCPSTL
ncbi:MAG: MBL fold metallo-hydrolase [Bacteroidetes bacterium]|nr:MAG: MBL fold metallo-hydrolase [Bacteroidota bacterium]